MIEGEFRHQIPHGKTDRDRRLRISAEKGKL